MSDQADFRLGHYHIQVKNASAADYRYIPVGAGLFRANLSLITNDVSASPYYLAFRYKNAIGTWNEVVIDSGLIQNRVYAHVQNVEFEGPGSFMAYLLPTNAPSSMTFAAYIRRVNP